MPSLSPSLYAAAVLCLAAAAPAASITRPSTPAETSAALKGDGFDGTLIPSKADPVPEPETPFQVIAFAGLLLIWRNRQRVVAG